MEENIYKPPTANLNPMNETDSSINGGSLETAILGQYSFGIGETIKEAWRLTKGNKGVILLSVFILTFIYVVANKALAMLGVPDGSTEMSSGSFVLGYSMATMKGFLLLPLTAPLIAGFYMLCIKRSVNIPKSLDELFAYFGKVLPLVILSLISSVLIYIGYLLLLLPGIYLAIAYIFATPLMIDKNLTPWQSLEASRKAVTHNWFKFLGLGILLYLILVLSIISVVGWIWAVPMCMIAYGVLYQKIFGVSTS